MAKKQGFWAKLAAAIIKAMKAFQQKGGIRGMLFGTTAGGYPMDDNSPELSVAEEMEAEDADESYTLEEQYRADLVTKFASAEGLSERLEIKRKLEMISPENGQWAWNLFGKERDALKKAKPEEIMNYFRGEPLKGVRPYKDHFEPTPSADPKPVPFLGAINRQDFDGPVLDLTPVRPAPRLGGGGAVAPAYDDWAMTMENTPQDFMFDPAELGRVDYSALPAPKFGGKDFDMLSYENQADAFSRDLQAGKWERDDHPANDNENERSGPRPPRAPSSPFGRSLH
ncbi:hypothetical protein ELG97_37140 [Rhizobium leguminosarum]|uniref:hypothetical protein n=1 Tax=Rhizobium leguminosarum TaxID=384 RepID=UPI0010325E9D|nr:hypothetical protein [Rhizobium leguminosarum]TBE73857.1 hypothetical protein ELG97_37140 [Rhizobium leguminosarum]